ncbi:MAG: ATP-binding cassette domain-containing protein, partial [Desulfamplus sp.]|nr:ATP-binding cassette domain-containing protein [Desulfamplus sp.]
NKKRKIGFTFRKDTTLKDRHEAMAALETMGMAEYADRKIGNLSGGQRQRVFIARALVTQPKILLLDEPTSSIDNKGQTDFFKMLEELNRDITILVVSHNLFVVSNFVKSVICMNRQLHYHKNFNKHLSSTELELAIIKSSESIGDDKKSPFTSYQECFCNGDITV